MPAAETQKRRMEISEDVISMCAMDAALRTDGVSSMDEVPLNRDPGRILDREQPCRGIAVRKDKDGLILEVYLRVRYGCRIPETSWDLQENIKNRVQDLTGMPVGRVNIHIQGVDYDNGDI